MSIQKRSYESFRLQLRRYVDANEVGDEALPIIDGVLEFLAVTGRLDPSEFEGWPADGLMAPILEDAKGASA